VYGGRLRFPFRQQRQDRRGAAAQDHRPAMHRKARMVHRERADMRRAMMQLGRQFRGGRLRWLGMTPANTLRLALLAKLPTSAIRKPGATSISE
jgi:hypothetical protein